MLVTNETRIYLSLHCSSMIISLQVILCWDFCFVFVFRTGSCYLVALSVLEFIDIPLSLPPKPYN